MAKQKAEGKISKADAVREAIKEGVEKPQDGVSYVKEKHGLDITPQQFSTYKANDKKKAGAPPARRGRKPAAVTAARASTNGTANMAAQMERIKALVDSLGVE